MWFYHDADYTEIKHGLCNHNNYMYVVFIFALLNIEIKSSNICPLSQRLPGQH